MDYDDIQQFSLRWHNHQPYNCCSRPLLDIGLSHLQDHEGVAAILATLGRRVGERSTLGWLAKAIRDVETRKDAAHLPENSVVGALGRMLSTGALTDVTLSAGGTSVKAHKLVLASCSQYFAQLFKEVEAENNTLVVVLTCDVAELRLLLTFMYTGEVTASKKVLPSLLRLAQTLRVSGLTDADTNSTLTPTETEPQDEPTNSPINLDVKNEPTTPIEADSKLYDEILSPQLEKDSYDIALKTERDRLSKLDQIVQNLYSTHKIGNPTITTPPNNIDPPNYNKNRPANSICSICNKALSNQYNLRVHMETHAGRRHACRACGHVSRSRDALRKHVAYRHAQRRDV